MSHTYFAKFWIFFIFSRSLWYIKRQLSEIVTANVSRHFKKYLYLTSLSTISQRREKRTIGQIRVVLDWKSSKSKEITKAQQNKIQSRSGTMQRAQSQNQQNARRVLASPDNDGGYHRRSSAIPQCYLYSSVENYFAYVPFEAVMLSNSAEVSPNAPPAISS